MYIVQLIAPELLTLNTPCFVYIDFPRNYGERFIIFISNQPVLLREMKKLFESLWQTLQVGCFIINWGILLNFSFDQKSMWKIEMVKMVEIRKNAKILEYNFFGIKKKVGWKSFLINKCSKSRVIPISLIL